MDEEQLLSKMDQFWLFAEQHRGAIIGGILLTLLACIGLGVLIWRGHLQEEQAWALQQQATKLYIDRPLDNPEKTKEHLEQAISLFRQILEDYPRTSSAELAYYFIGNAFAELNNYQEAIQAYHQFEEHYGKNRMLLGLVYQRLGYTYLMKDEKEKAIEAFKQVLNLPEALNKDSVLFEMGKLEEEQNHTAQALTYYKELANQHLQSPWLGEALMRIKALEPPEPEKRSDNKTEDSPPVPEASREEKK